MTMSLARGLSTINTKKPKQKKLTQAKLDKLRIQWRQYNKDMRRKHLHSLQYDNFDDYVAYTQGTAKPSKQQSRGVYDPNKHGPYVRKSPNIPSMGDGVGSYAPRKESQKYTGDLIVGIATMHKSNAVPVMRGTTQAKDIASMRR